MFFELFWIVFVVMVESPLSSRRRQIVVVKSSSSSSSRRQVVVKSLSSSRRGQFVVKVVKSSSRRWPVFLENPSGTPPSHVRSDPSSYYVWEVIRPLTTFHYVYLGLASTQPRKGTDNFAI